MVDLPIPKRLRFLVPSAMHQQRKLLFLSLLLAFCPSIFSKDRPNIVFIFSDDHAVQAISSYGGRLTRVAPTPNIDRIAREGALFENSFCGNAICGPSRASILTGKLSHLNGFMDNNTSRFDGSQVTFPKLLQNTGYVTALIGKWHLKSTPQGFDHWEILPGQGNYYNPHFIRMDGSRIQRFGYVTDIVTDLAIEWLEETAGDEQPFVLMCQQKAPHRNWAPPERHLTLFDDVQIPEPETLFDTYADRSEVLRKQEMSIAEHFYWNHDMKFRGENAFPEFFKAGKKNREYDRMTPGQKLAWDAAYEPKNRAFIEWMQETEPSSEDVTRWKYQRYMKDYLRCIRALDEGIGRLLDTLDRTGLSENTIVIYASDQGFYLGEHGWYDKRWMFEESMKMPFVVRWPGVIEPGSRPETMIQNIDYAPTFLEVAGVAIPEAMQGRSLVPAFERAPETPPDWRDALYYSYSGERTHAVAAHDGVRTARYKLIRFPETSEWNLFDLEKDPQELRSVHADPAYASVFKNLSNRYRELRRDYQVNSAVVPRSRLSLDWWKTRFEEKQAILSNTGQNEADIVFIGDSITQGWEDAGRRVWTEQYQEHGAINLGFSGDRTEHVIWRLFNGDLSAIDPKVAVVMVGTNNTGHRLQDAEETTLGIRRITEILGHRWPDTEILLLNLFPRGEEPDDPKRLLNHEVCNRIKELGGRKGITYLDIGYVFLEPDGTISSNVMPDFLHLSPLGYRLWAEAMSEQLDKLLGP
jgi:N-acetylglucosamine-6-sulfatase